MNELSQIKIEGHKGSWYSIDTRETELHGTIYLLESEQYGDGAACLIVDSDLNVLVENVYNGFEDYNEKYECN
jgi:hypothetical protein